jgi:rfaE bifunctional protein nucleotidyltransferase chain/domain
MPPHSQDHQGEQAAARLARLPRPLVFTNGVFDILHRGHVSCLVAARALGASLVVALNSDASARGLGKGPGRPLNTGLDRACVIGALEAVDGVLFFDEPTPLAVLARCRPDLYIKGGDYDIEALAETALVRSWGGQALALPFVDGYSTTRLVQRVSGLAGAGTVGPSSTPT